MHHDDFMKVHKGMDVYDRDDDKVGSVGEVFTTAGATTASSSGMAGSMGSNAGGWFKVDTGFLGLGKDLFIPADAISSIQGDKITLNVDKDDIDTFGWDKRPAGLPD